MIRKGMFIGDRYEIVDKVGSGGMSDVYKALDHKLNRYVAIKVLKPEFSEDKTFVSKFKVEAQSAAGLVHPNIVNVYDVGEDDTLHYIVMELIDGITLKKYIEKKGPLPVKEAVSIAIQVSQGIEAAHNNNIIHRDIKPQNIMISREGKVKVTDFGIARAASSNTINSNAMGSVHYISPEQARGGYIDEKSDIYSLGITLYELITGKVPFEGDSTVSVALQHINDEIPSPKEIVPDLPVSVEKIILKCTQKKPDRRYAKVSALIADLKHSLIAPDEDFVQITSPAVSNRTTVMMTDEEVSKIRNEAVQYPEEENDEYIPGEDDDDEGEESYEDDEDDIFGEEDDIDSGNPKMDKVIFIGAIVSGVVFIILAIILAINTANGCGGSKSDDESTTTAEAESIKSTQTKVPKVVGKSEDEAVQMLSDAHLGYKISSQYHNTIPKGDVISQSTDEGTVVDKNTTIEIVVSQGAKKNTMPEVIGQDKDSVKTLLEGEDYGLIVTFEYQNSTSYEANKVIGTNPEAKTDIYFGDSVVVYVSQGSDTSDSEVPNVIDMSQEKAKATLESKGLSMKVENEAYSDSIAAGNIIVQDIKDGKTVPRGTTIGVTVSKGAEPTTTQAPTTAQAPTTTKAPETTTTKAPETTTKPAETEKTTFTANFPSRKASDFGVSEDVTDGQIKAVLSYTNKNGENVTKDVTASAGITTRYSTNWSQNASIEASDVKAATEAKITYTLTYTDAEGEHEATAVSEAVFN